MDRIVAAIAAACDAVGFGYYRITGKVMPADTADMLGGIAYLVVIGAVVALIMLLAGCVGPHDDPLAVYSVDPKAFTFAVVPF